ncbi:MAG: hypothetical protein WAQ28_02080 [Bacteroidia bacterium]
MRLAYSAIDSENVFRLSFVNPFDQEEKRNFDIPLNEMIEGVMFTALKQFITEKLKSAYDTNSEIHFDELLWNKFALCCTQVYQFNSIDTLITHLLKYREHLHKIPEYNEVLTYFNIKANV